MEPARDIPAPILALLREADVVLNGERPWDIRLRQSLMERCLNLQSIEPSTRVARRHYDIPTAIYEAMLDRWLLYSCGYWECADSLQQAQEHKLHLICRRLDLRPGLRLLDIGCGWGGLAAFAARH